MQRKVTGMHHEDEQAPRPVTERRGPAFRARRGFTLTELIVAIGVTVILVLGIGRIFSMTKTTISVGQATAELNQYARTLERLMRQDLERMTTEGFLVIRNERIGIGDDDEIGNDINRRPVFLNEEDHKKWIEEGRPDDEYHMGVRRLDQLVFFATGDYTSYQFQNAFGDGFAGSGGRGIISRNDVAPTARIWYGHGLQSIRRYDASLDGASNTRQLREGAEIKSGPGMNGYRAFFADPRFDPEESRIVQESNGIDTVNVYARDWILGRQAALLLRREAAGIADPRVPTYHNLNIAPSFIEFHNESPTYFLPPFFLPQYDLRNYSDYRSMRRRLSPGFVDIIGMDLPEIEKAVTEYGFIYLERDAGGDQEGETVYRPDPIGRQLGSGAWDNWSADAQRTLDQPVYSYVSRSEDRQLLDDDIAERWLQGQWMRMGLATGRLRAETAPPNLTRFNQMLTHSTLTPGCSNLEIAWSTGEVDFPSGDIVWYDINQPANPYVAAIDPRTGEMQRGGTRERFERAPSDPRIWYLSELPWQALTGTNPFPSQGLWPGKGMLRPAQAANTYFGLFGYFVPKVREGGDKRFDTTLNEREDRSDAWPWPKMLRIRVTLHDRTGAISGGRTFEFIFDLPTPRRG